MRWSSRPPARRTALGHGPGGSGIPHGELAAFARALFRLGYGVEPIDVAERFHVREHEAARALAELCELSR